MRKGDIDDIDYENLDDLPLLDRIEWNHCITEDVGTADLNQFELLWAALLPVSFTLSLLKKYPGYLPSKIKRRGATFQFRKPSLPD